MKKLAIAWILIQNSVKVGKIVFFGWKMSSAWEKYIKEWWWVVAFMILCYMLYEKGMRTRNAVYENLEQHYLNLLEDKHQNLALQDDLMLQINSQSDPAWIELTLIKGLGLVPEGTKKIFFSSN
jgi:hypothetical protein